MYVIAFQVHQLRSVLAEGVAIREAVFRFSCL